MEATIPAEGHQATFHNLGMFFNSKSSRPLQPGRTYENCDHMFVLSHQESNMPVIPAFADDN